MTALDEIRDAIATQQLHTIELGAVDSYGHLRGKRIPAARFVESVATGGANIADAIYIFDVQCAIVDSPFVNMEQGFADMRLVPDLTTFRVLAHRGGYGIVMADAVDHRGAPHRLSPRQVLQTQVERCRGLGFDPVAAVELECYVTTENWECAQPHVQYSSLSDAVELEVAVREMREALLGCGVPIESSNAEYGPGQLEINFAPADPVTTADNTALYKMIIKEIALRHGLRATFMAKPWAEHSGSGMHLHTSLGRGATNVFAGCVDRPDDVMAHWVAGLLAHARAMQLLMIPTPNGYKRVRPYTFAPTHVHWGRDNRSLLARCTLGEDRANRVEYRAAGADANAHLALAAVLAAGCDGLEQQLSLPPMAEGDLYATPGDHPELPATPEAAIAAFEGSALATMLGADFSANYVVLARNELAHFADAITDWERARYLEFS
jgi:glutamine synthetase